MENNTPCGMFHARLGMSLWGNGKILQAYDRLQKAKSIGKTIGSDIVIGYSCTWLSFVCSEMGRYQEGIAFAQKGHEIPCEVKSDHYLYFKSLYGVGHNNSFMGNASDNKPIAEALINFCKRYSHIRCLVLAYLAEGYYFSAAGDSQAAIRSLEKAEDLAVDPFYKFLPKMELCSQPIKEGLIDKAETVDLAMREFYSGGVCSFYPWVIDGLSGLVDIQRGELSRGIQAAIAAKKSANLAGAYGIAIILECAIELVSSYIAVNFQTHTI
jgi:tetratricopeptide (TPR) repeat protein